MDLTRKKEIDFKFVEHEYQIETLLHTCWFTQNTRNERSTLD
jgi:hypothetical protein